jgi:hypothetical protein
MDKAMASSMTNDAMIFNAATIATINRSLAVQATAWLQKYLSSHEPDEQWVNLYGIALDRAWSNPSNRGALHDRIKTIDQYQSQLETKKPGSHRWGSQWISEAQFQSIEAQKESLRAKRATLQSAIDNAQNNLNSAKQSLNAALNDYSAQQGRNARTADPASVNYWQGQVTLFQNNLRNAKSAYDAAGDDPKPTWTVPLTGQIPSLELAAK